MTRPKRARRATVRYLVRGARVGLRYARPPDRAEFLALLAASRRFLAPWEPRVEDPSGKKRFEKLLKGRRNPHSRRYLVCRLKDGAILGAFSISNIVRGVGQSATLGVWIGAPYARQGYMREATQLVLDQAFRGLGLHRVEANFLPRNKASRALARGAGFRREGYSPKYVKIAGRWQDHERWALLEEEWRNGRRRRRE